MPTQLSVVATKWVTAPTIARSSSRTPGGVGAVGTKPGLPDDGPVTVVVVPSLGLPESCGPREEVALPDPAVVLVASGEEAELAVRVLDAGTARAEAGEVVAVRGSWLDEPSPWAFAGAMPRAYTSK
ncbi:MAG: hypothetical protein ACR2LX_03620 [Jatrophihabitans sp.]